MFRFEWKKLLAFPVLWVLLICFLFVNGYTQISGTKSRYYTPESYRDFFSAVAGMSLSETLDFVEEEITHVADGTADFPTVLLYDMEEKCEDLMAYPDYIAGIETQKEIMSSVSIWGDETTFSYRNIQKTPSAYVHLTETELTLAPSLGVEDTTKNKFTDFLALIFIFVIACTILLKDREHGMLSLLCTTQNGHARLFVVKFSTCFLCVIGTTLLFFAENVVIGASLYGIGDLSRPVQTISGLYTCNLSITVGEYLILYLLLKLLVYVTFAAFFLFVCTAAQNNLAVYGITVGICAVEFLLWKFVSEFSTLNLLHFLNLIQFTQTSEILGTYQNLNYFGYPFSLKISVIGICVVLGIALFFGGIGVFSCTRRTQYRHISLSIFHTHRIRTHGNFFYVCYRTLVLQKGWIVVLALVFASGFFSSTIARAYQNDDIYYENFTTEYAGKITSETYDFIAEKESHYDAVQDEIETYIATGNGSSYLLDNLYSELNDHAAFERFRERVDTIDANEFKGEIFYDTGYERLFGVDENTENTILSLLILSFLVLFLSPIPATDRRTKMTKIIYASGTGKYGYWKNNFFLAALASIFASILCTLPYLWQIFRCYGTQGLAAPVQSIVALSGFSLSVSVGELIIGMILVRTIAAIFSGILIQILAYICRLPMTAYLVNAAIFILPAILVLLGVSEAGLFGVEPFVAFYRLIVS